MSMSIDPHADLSAPATELSSFDRPFQFRLRTLLLFIAAIAVLTAVLTRVGPAWSIAVVLGTLLISVHVMANAWGTRASNRASQRRGDESTASDGQESLETLPLQFAPHTRLRDRRRQGWLTPLCTVCGAAIGGTLGTALFYTLYFGVGGYAAVVTGGFSAAVVGGFLGYLASTFLGVASRALSEASGASRPRDS